MSLSVRFALLTVPMFWIGLPAPLSAQTEKAQRGQMTAGNFLSGGVSERRSLRRSSNFLSVEKLGRSLQLALVIDGTESMQEELQNVSGQLLSFLSGLRQLKREEGTEISVAVIVYRDRDARAGPVEPILDRFEADLNRVTRKISEVTVDTGAPYFREQVDAGIGYALDKLDWSTDEQTARWMIVIGDAPPYPEGAELRTRSTRELIQKARERKIEIYGMVTAFGFLDPELDNEQLLKTAEQERPQMRTFLAELSRNTGGQVVDLLDSQEVRYWMTNTLTMSPITEAEIEAARRSEGHRGADGQSGLRIAVLPHISLQRMTFDVTDQEQAVAIARMIHERLGRLSGVSPLPADTVQRAFERARGALAAEGRDLRPENLFPLLSGELGASFIVWGETQQVFDSLSLEVGLYTGTDGAKVGAFRQSADARDHTGQTQLIAAAFDKSRQRAVDQLRRDEWDRGEVSLLAQVDKDTGLAEEMLSPLANDSRAQQSILAALELIERSLATARDADATGAGDGSEARKALLEARRHLDRALAIEPDSPFAHYLLANCHFNLSRHQEADEDLARYYELLKKAYDLRDHAPAGSNRLLLEIEAEYQLTVINDVAMALASYRQLAEFREDGGGRFGLRARWMLAGIHMGDWGAISHAPELVDPRLARLQIIQILAHWPDSPEAAFYRRCIEQSESDDVIIPVGHRQLASSR